MQAYIIIIVYILVTLLKIAPLNIQHLVCLVTMHVYTALDSIYAAHSVKLRRVSSVLILSMNANTDVKTDTDT